MEPVIVTPTTALGWRRRIHHHCHDNVPRRVNDLANRMRSGRPVTTARDPIVFDDDGHLISGQCRILALPEAGIPIELHVVGWVFGGSVEH